MNQIKPILKDVFVNRASAKLFLAASVLAFGVTPAGVVSADPLPQTVAYVANDTVYYTNGVNTNWSQMSVSNASGVAYRVLVGASGCVVYQNDNGEIVRKSTPATNDDAVILSAADVSFGDYAVDDNCGLLYESVDDAINGLSSLWYKSTPSSTPVQYNTQGVGFITQIAVGGNGAVAYVDQDRNLWYQSNAAASPQLLVASDATTLRMNDSNNIVYQDINSLVWYKDSPSATAIQLSDPDIAPSNAISIDANGGVEWMCNTGSIYYKAPNATTAIKITDDNIGSAGILSSDGNGVFYQTLAGALAYWTFSSDSSTQLTDDYTMPSSFDIY